MTKKVLIVEDDPDILKAVVEAMESEGFEVAYALDISVAEALIRTGLPDVAIIDHSLPDGTGSELCQKIRAEGETPVIMFTAQADQATVMECMDSGAVDYVLKGTGLDELVSRVLKHTA